MEEAPPSPRIVRALAWIFAALPLFYFVVYCMMAADARSGLGTSDVDPGNSLWCFWVKRLSAHIGAATFVPPAAWIFTALFTQQTKGQFVAQAVLVTGGSCILVASWGMAAQILH